MIGSHEVAVRLSMERYFFDLRDDGLLIVDESGLEMPDMDTMQTQAALLLIELNRDHFMNNRPGMVAVEVRDGDGAVMKAHLAFDFSRTGGPS
jgi:hypothetical protein